MSSDFISSIMLSGLVLMLFACASQGRRDRTLAHSLRNSPLNESGKASGKHAFAKLLFALNVRAAPSVPSERRMWRASQARQGIPRATPKIPFQNLHSANVGNDAPPITLLGGFLGAGKTTALTHMLTNRKGLKIAVIVNDVAAVNVDAATMRRRTIEFDNVETVELENGCVCCGPGAGELPPLVLSLRNRRNDDGSPAFDHIVVELSGVADPSNVERNLVDNGADVARKVALVDANAFPEQYLSVSRVRDRADLSGEAIDKCALDRKVIELLLQQIETADVVLVNKCDLASGDECSTTLAACRALNLDAKIISTTYGDAQLNALLPLETSDGNILAKCNDPDCKDPNCKDPDCEDQKKGYKDIECNDHKPGCENKKCENKDCKDPDCKDHEDTECSGPGCKNNNCKDSDCKNEEKDAGCKKKDCKDPDCKDTSCEKSQNTVSNSVESIGFQTYVYRARKPFSEDRLVSLLKRWPLPMKNILTTETIASPGGERLGVDRTGKDTTFANVLRSKGTAWIESEHRIEAEWSHAGRHLGLGLGGPWWATLPTEIMRAALSTSGENTTEESDAYRAELSKFDRAGEFGDRRQEIVFIGTNLNTDKIGEALDSCLLTAEEMEQYKAHWSLEDQEILADKGPLRFDIGAKVECNVGEWASGIVVKHFYREAHWPVGMWAPYQISLEDGQLIYAPADIDDVIRRA